MLRILFFYFISIVGLQAQKPSDIILEKACDCLEEYDFKATSIEELLQSAEQCLKDALLTNITGLAYEYNISLDDSEAMQNVGDKLAQRLFKFCAPFREFSIRMAVAQTKQAAKKYDVTIGKLKELTNNRQGQTLFLVQVPSGENEAFLWLEEFDGSARFFGGLEEFQNKRAEIHWEPIEVYNPKEKIYETFKKIKLINILEE